MDGVTGPAQRLDDLPLHPGGFALTDRAMDLCGFGRGARLLDLGCGWGATLRHLTQKYGVSMGGIDIDAGLVEGRAGLICASAEAIPLPDESLDGVLMECSLSVMDDPDAVVRECRRVLKSGGRLALSDVYARGEAAALRGCLGRLERSETQIARLERSGFRLELFEDHSEELRRAWGQMLFEKGAEASCSELGTDVASLRAIRIGYFLAIARKGASR